MIGVVTVAEGMHDRLKHLRTIKGLSQKFVAEKIGVKNNTLSGYESGRREPDATTLAKIAELYEVSIDYIVTGKDFTQQAKDILDDPETQIAARDGDVDSERALELIREILEKQNKEK